jgi:hypothetical protein
VGVKSLAERAWSKVERRGADECWPWRGASGSGGRGHIIRAGRGSAFVPASRAIYEAVHGAVPYDHDVCHTCDNGACCNPRHLFAATHKANMLDMVKKERQPNRKLTWDIVREIRGATGTNTELGHRFGISRVQVANIRQNRQWVT